jgi:hypothetical protein
MRVMLMPIVLLSKPRATEWRATIRPSNWKDWWESYRSMIGYFAQIAQDHHVDVFVVGSELVTTESLVNDWNQTIDSIRQIYKGRLTYSSNWDHYPMVKFWDKLDFIGMNSYWTLGQNRDVTVKEVADNWRSIQEDLGKFAKENKKSILFLELGWCSLSNAADEPWDYTKENLPADPQLQEKLWIGFFEAWSMTDWLGGYAIWDWKPGPCGPADKGYGVKGKPAYVVIKSL